MDVLGLFNKKKYKKLAVKKRSSYEKNKPFPHIILDNFFDKNISIKLEDKFPEYNQSNYWIHKNNDNICKKYQFFEQRMPVEFRLLFRELMSTDFLLFLETITGIKYLIPDPYMIGGGLHISSKGDYLKKHIDFNWNHMIQAYRRLTVLFFFNSNWKEEYNGNLILYNFNKKSLSQSKDVHYTIYNEEGLSEKSIMPINNRVVIFPTTKTSIHGVPQPLNTPPGVYRKSFNLYYYSRYENDKIEDDMKSNRDNSGFSKMIIKDYLK